MAARLVLAEPLGDDSLCFSRASPIELEALALRRDLRLLGLRSLCATPHASSAAAAGAPRLLPTLLHGRRLPRCGGGGLEVALPLFGIGAGARPVRLLLSLLDAEPGDSSSVTIDAAATEIVLCDAGTRGEFPPLLEWLTRAQHRSPGHELALRRIISAASSGGGALIAGPSGSGKRTVALAVAAASGRPVFHVSGASLYRGDLGSSEEALLGLREALRDAAPCVVLIDGADILLPAQPRSALARRCAAALLHTMDMLKAEGRQVLWLATASSGGSGGIARGDEGECGSEGGGVSPRALGPSRLAVVISLSFPALTARAAMLRHLTRLMCPPPGLVDGVARRTHGFSPADLALLAANAVSAATAAAADVNSNNDADAIAGSRSFQAAIVVSRSAFDAALLMTQPSLLLQAIGSAPRDVRLDRDVVGMRATVAAAKLAVLDPLEHAGVFRALGAGTPRGLLLHGPHGSGKTLLAHALAHRASAELRVANALVIQGPDVVSARVGSSEAALAAVFARARELSPCVLVLDQFETIAAARGGPGSAADGASRAGDRLLSMLLTEMDGLASGGECEGASAGGEAVPVVVVIAVTHDVKLLDPAVVRPGRLDCHVALGRPGRAERRLLLASCLARSPLRLLAGGVQGVAAGLAAGTRGWSRAALVGLWEAAAMAALRRDFAAGGGGAGAAIEEADLAAALAAGP